MRVFSAACEKNIVTCNGQVVENCPILGEGVGASQGYLVIAEDELVYLPKTTPDVKALCDLLVEAFDFIASEIYQANLGGDITAPSFGLDITGVRNKIKALGGNLR